MSTDPVISTMKRDLPDDVTREILSRLPAKSLLRFSCVCKSWYDLLKNPTFIKQHSNHFASIDNHCYLFSHYNLRTDTTEFSVLSHATGKLTPIGKPCPGPLGLMGSFNGLVCVTNTSSPTFANYFMLLNPALCEFKVIPMDQSPKSNLKQSKSFRVCAGFGFDSRSGDYRIVRIEQFKDSFEVLITHVDVYSCNNDSWKRISVDTSVVLERFKFGQFWNGSIFFFSKDDNDIASFNLGTERFSIISIPVFGPPIKAIRINAWKDQLALVCSGDSDPLPEYEDSELSDYSEDDYYTDDDDLDDYIPGDYYGDDDDQIDDVDPDDNPGDLDHTDDGFIEVWTMRENNSWTKEYIFQHDMGHLVYLGTKNDGDFLLLCQDDMITRSYDETTKRASEVDFPVSNFCTITCYNESLMTINAKIKMEKMTSSRNWNVLWILSMFSLVYFCIVGVGNMLARLD